MKKPLIILIFLLFPLSVFSQGSVIYNGLSHEYQADPQKTASEYGPMNSGWKWQKRDFGNSLAAPSQGFQSALATPIKSSPVSVSPSYFSATQPPVVSSYIQKAPLSAGSPLIGYEPQQHFEQDTTMQLQPPAIRWKFAKPQQELEPVIPAVAGREDEAAHNNPEAVVKGEPNTAVLAEDSAYSNLIADEEKDTINWILVE